MDDTHFGPPLRPTPMQAANVVPYKGGFAPDPGTANYRDNLMDGEPCVWVALRHQGGGMELELTNVTADPTEGEALFESGTDVIRTVPMPQDIAAWIAAVLSVIPSGSPSGKSCGRRSTT